MQERLAVLELRLCNGEFVAKDVHMIKEQERLGDFADEIIANSRRPVKTDCHSISPSNGLQPPATSQWSPSLRLTLYSLLIRHAIPDVFVATSTIVDQSRTLLRIQRPWSLNGLQWASPPTTNNQQLVITPVSFIECPVQADRRGTGKGCCIRYRISLALVEKNSMSNKVWIEEGTEACSEAWLGLTLVLQTAKEYVVARLLIGRELSMVI